MRQRISLRYILDEAIRGLDFDPSLTFIKFENDEDYLFKPVAATSNELHAKLLTNLQNLSL
ncbi:MAG: hypothetical protein ABII21_01930 [bacterium]